MISSTAREEPPTELRCEPSELPSATLPQQRNFNTLPRNYAEEATGPSEA